jgi:transcriptional regulator with XRE-family HTH domain
MDPQVAELLGIDTDDPVIRREAEAVDRDMNLIETLVSLRKDSGLTQREVAKRMGRTQPAVSDFERVGGDPHLSSIRRYALAIGANVRHSVEVCSELSAEWSRTAHIPNLADMQENDPGNWSVGQLPITFEEAS